MKFTLSFASACRSELSGTTFQKIGLDVVNQIRAEANCPALPLEMIKGWVNTPGRYVVAVDLSEDTADLSGLFAETNEIEVIVPPTGLREFFRLKMDVRRNEATGAITSAAAELALDTKMLVSAWVKAGFPMEWNPRKEALVLAWAVAGCPTPFTPED